MEQYIPKSALVAEIEKIIADETESIKSFEHGKNVSEVQRSNARIGILMHIHSFLDTLEMEGADFDFTKEVDMWIEDNGDTNGFFNVEELAKHFFELGMTASNKAQKGE